MGADQAQEAKQDSRQEDEDSDASHCSMPELIPVNRPGGSGPSTSPSAPSSREANRGCNIAMATMRRLGIISRGRQEWRGHGQLAGKNDDSDASGTGGSMQGDQENQYTEGSLKRRKLSADDAADLKSPIGKITPKVDQGTSSASSDNAPNPFRLAVAGGQGFGKKIDALAQALDGLGPSAAGSFAAEDASVAPLCKSMCVDAEDPCVEVSAASERRLRMGRDEIDASLEEDEGDASSGDKADDDAEATIKVEAKRRKVSKLERLAVDVPPGAPATGGFGPRFRALPPEELKKAKSKWTLHSLSDVRASSSEENRRAACELFDTLRKQRSAKEGGAGTASGEGKAAEEQGASEGAKPTFRRPVAGRGKDGSQTKAADGSGSRSLAPGGRVMSTCIAGGAPRRTAAVPRPVVTTTATGEAEEEDEAIPLRRNAASAQKAARAARRRSIAADAEDGEDAI